MFLPKKNIPTGMTLYHDVGYGLPRAGSSPSRKFRIPVVHSKTVTDFDNWDMTFMERLVGGITMHKPLVPPEVVLTLSSCFDFWAIRAAQEWPQCRVTAHGFLGVHMEGVDAIIRSMGLADRLSYVRRDPSKVLHLDYPSDTFDMVRLSYCSLNLAETEWYMFLQEVHRVLKPGGVLEVIDEDLVFPGHRSKFNGNVPPVQRRRRESSVVPPLSAGSDSRFMLTPETRSKTSSLCNPVHTDSQYDVNESEDLPSSLQNAIAILDHSKLIKAWHEMLTSRLISASNTSVLPFYLSAIFDSFRALPALEILAGPSAFSPLLSHRFQQLLDPEAFRHLRHATVKADADSSVTWLPKNEAPPHFIPSQASMHLGRMVAIVASCKEAIWGAYNKLYCEEPRPRHPNDGLGTTNVSIMRDEFEYEWLKWEYDMQLRIGMGGNIKERLHWSVPPPDPDSERARLLKCIKNAQSEMDLIGIIASSKEPEVIRCVRGFVAWKFSGSAPEANLPSEQGQNCILVFS